jgi:hypothetical protein
MIESNTDLDGAGSSSPLKLPLWPLGLTTLWELYFDGIRPLDHLVILLYALLFLSQGHKRIRTQGILNSYPIYVLLFASIIVGVFVRENAWRPTTGIIEGILLLFFFSSSKNDLADATNFIRTMILMHCAALILQLAAYDTVHVTINYFSWIGRHTRVDVSGGIRPGGLFLEPAAYCLMMFSLLSVFRLLGEKCWWIEVAGILSIVASLSLWGLGACVIYLSFYRPKWAAICFPPVISIFAYVYININHIYSNNNIIIRLIVERLLNIGTDSSGQVRYGALLSGTIHSQWFFWFGKGISDNYQSYGANGLSFLLTAMGVLGSLIFCLCFALAVPRGRRVRALGSFIFMLSAANFWTSLWFWAWLALIIDVDPTNLKSRAILFGDGQRRVSHV